MPEHWKTTALRGKIRRYCEKCGRRVNISARYTFSHKRCKCGSDRTYKLIAMKPEPWDGKTL